MTKVQKPRVSTKQQTKTQRTDDLESTVLFNLNNDILQYITRNHMKLIERHYVGSSISYDDGKLKITARNVDTARAIAIIIEALVRQIDKLRLDVVDEDVLDLIEEGIQRPYEDSEFGTIYVDWKGNKVFPRTENQEAIVRAIQNNTITIAHGCAGTGKSKLALVCGLNYLNNNRFDRIIIVRPLVTVGADIGYLPGSLDEKYGPFTGPLSEALIDLVGDKTFDEMVKSKRILFTPTTFTRGANFRDAYVIIDEAQNLSKIELLTLLTRVTGNTKIVITGDESQSDRKKDKHSDSGLAHCVKVFKEDPSEEVELVKMTESDIQRHRLVGEIIKRFEE